MATAAEQMLSHPHIETIRRYCAAGSAGDGAGLASYCTDDVVHYMFEPGHEPVRGAEHLGRYWRKVVSMIGAEWTVEHAIACEDEAVAEWSMKWTSPDDGKRYIVHGIEWYMFREGRIAEVRSYYRHRGPEDTGLIGFPYAERGYTVIDRASTPT